MTVYLLGMVLAAGALVAVLWPLWRPPVAAESDDALGQSVNRALFRQRLSEIDADAAPEDGVLVEQLKDEAGARLLDEARDVRPPGGRDGPRGLAVALAVLVPILGVVVYLVVGEPDAGRLRAFDRVLSDAMEAPELASLVQAMQDRTASHPGEVKTYYLLGQGLMRQQRYDAAGESFAKAHALQGPEPGIDIAWLQARYLAGGGALGEKDLGLFRRVAAEQPQHPLVLEIGALASFREGDYARSVGLLERAVAALGEGPRSEALTEVMALARARMADGGRFIDVAVQASAPVPPGSTLFVVARPVAGGMPYAVVRRPAATLPLTVRLDDAVSMSPANPLSNADEVVVVARISESGQALPSPGDWQWQSEPIRMTGPPPALEALLEPPG